MPPIPLMCACGNVAGYASGVVGACFTVAMVLALHVLFSKHATMHHLINEYRRHPEPRKYVWSGTYSEVYVLCVPSNYCRVSHWQQPLYLERYECRFTLPVFMVRTMANGRCGIVFAYFCACIVHAAGGTDLRRVI